jgi:hypothetical protein
MNNPILARVDLALVGVITLGGKAPAQGVAGVLDLILEWVQIMAT